MICLTDFTRLDYLGHLRAGRAANFALLAMCVVGDCSKDRGLYEDSTRVYCKLDRLVSHRLAFTRVELLVVAFVVGLALVLLVPFLQQTRELQRRSECSNHLKQISEGMLAHVSANGYYPSAGWGARWAGDPNRGYGRRQPGSWMYSILPFVDQGSIWRNGVTNRQGTITESQKQQLGLSSQIPQALFSCASRRASKPYPCPSDTSFHNLNFPNSSAKTAVRSDYSASGGSSPVVIRNGRSIPTSVSTLQWGDGPEPNRALACESRWFLGANGLPFDLDRLGFNGIARSGRKSVLWMLRVV